MERYFEKAIKSYEKVLVEELGEGKLKIRLLKKLETILTKKSQGSQNDLFNNPLDYDSLLKTNPNPRNHNLYVRIHNALKGGEIENTDTLAKACYEHYKKKSRSWKNEKTYVSFLQHFRNIGEKSSETLISHLKSINFDFSQESARKVAEER